MTARPRGMALGARFMRFAAVGAAGFAVDAGVLLALVAAGWAGPIGGRLVSFTCAVLVTFELNRRWSFKGDATRPYPVMLALYLGVQGVGLACNFGLYWLAYLALPPPLNHPLLCLVVASAAALAVNFAGLQLMVFGRSDPATRRSGGSKCT